MGPETGTSEDNQGDARIVTIEIFVSYEQWIASKKRAGRPSLTTEFLARDITIQMSFAAHEVQGPATLSTNGSPLTRGTITMNKGQDLHPIATGVLNFMAQPIQGSIDNRPALFKIHDLMTKDLDAVGSDTGVLALQVPAEPAHFHTSGNLISAHQTQYHA